MYGFLMLRFPCTWKQLHCMHKLLIAATFGWAVMIFRSNCSQLPFFAILLVPTTSFLVLQIQHMDMWLNNKKAFH